MTDDYPYRYQPPPPAPVETPRRGLLVGLGAGVIGAALVLGGVAFATSDTSTIAGSGSITELSPGGSTPGGNAGPTVPGPSGSGGAGPGSAGKSGTATATQQIGVVTIVSTLRYQNAQSAGTGMVASTDGEILTNNHVIRGATSIVATVESTGKSYRADVVGTAPNSDIAVLQLRNASGLATARLAADAAGLRVGDQVTGVGNAGGTGTLTAASGMVTALNRSITAADETGQEAERLSNLIEINAKIIAGDSGGPLYNDSGEIVGINTAASAKHSASSSAYAIRIDDARAIAGKIESGVETTSIHIGYPGFLGVSTGNANGNGARVRGLLSGGPAAAAGITAGSTVTAIDGTAVTSAQSLRSALAAKAPGTRVVVTWTDANGSARSATVTLAVGPAD